MKTQRKQMNAKSLLNNAFWNVYFIFFYTYDYQAWRIRRNCNQVQSKLINSWPNCLENEKIAASVHFRNDLLESQKRSSYQNEFDRLQGAQRLSALHPNVKSRMKELHNKARQSLKGETHNIYRTKF